MRADTLLAELQHNRDRFLEVEGYMGTDTQVTEWAERQRVKKAMEHQVGSSFLHPTCWRKDIEDYEGLYYIDKVGIIYSYGNKSNHKEDIILSPSIDKDGYKKVTLYKDGKKGYYRVCRLMGNAWLPNPLGLDFINHKNEIKDDDRLDNLEWISPYGNWKHSEASQSNQELSVIKLSLEGDYICEYKSLMDAARDNGINQGNITNCLAGRCKSVGGFKWLKK